MPYLLRRESSHSRLQKLGKALRSGRETIFDPCSSWCEYVASRSFAPQCAGIKAGSENAALTNQMVLLLHPLEVVGVPL